MNYLDFIKDSAGNPEKYGVYAKSVNTLGDAMVFMADIEGEIKLVSTKNVGFTGIKNGNVTVAPLSHENADVLRSLFPFTAPTKVLGKDKMVHRCRMSHDLCKSRTRN